MKASTVYRTVAGLICCAAGIKPLLPSEMQHRLPADDVGVVSMLILGMLWTLLAELTDIHAVLRQKP